MDFLPALLLPDNLYWAWIKVRNFYRSLDGWYDELAVAEFELNLARELKSIGEQFKRQQYHTSPLRPLPQPKRKDAKGKIQTRQMFWVSVRDQVAWTAYLNVIGPVMDLQMPPWSYGNRLYRSVWFDDSTKRPQLRIGKYRNSSGQIYRPFRQSWPVFRRHVHLTVKKMAGTKDRELRQGESPESRVFETELALGPEYRLPYLSGDFWRAKSPAPFWAGLDFEKFYPTTNLKAITNVLREEFVNDPRLVGRLLDNLLAFEIDDSGFNAETMSEIGLRKGQGAFPHLPTGLMAAGFLANLALLKVDRRVFELARIRQIAHFRYVDDHVILAPTFESLENWIAEYGRLLEEHQIGVQFNPCKSEPEQLSCYLSALGGAVPEEIKAKRDAAEFKCKLDPSFPTPLMTQTLAKISDVNHNDFDVLDEREQQAVLADLEHLMLADLPTHELRPDTRVSFAAARISRIAVENRPSVRELVILRRNIISAQSQKHWKSETEKKATVAQLKRNLKQRSQAYKTALKTSRRRTLRLLLKALAEYPEKLRLWQQVLRYCQRSGEGDFPGVLALLRRVQAENKFAAPFMEASFLKILGRQMIECGKTICSLDALPDDRAAAKAYLQSIFDQHLLDGPSDVETYYSESAWHAFASAAGLTLACLQEGGCPENISAPLMKAIDRRSSTSQAWNWLGKLAPQAKGTGRSVAVWIWWAEFATEPALSVNPGVAWRLHARSLSVADPESWATWRLHPASLPREARSALKSGLGRISAIDRVFLLAQQSVAIRQRRASQMSLLNWVVWARNRRQEDPFDPREGEWTCLEIVRQIAKLMLRSKRRADLIHPQNFRVPELWTINGNTPPWDEWHRIVREAPITFDKGPLIREVRLRTSTPINREINAFDEIYGLAVLLLGLLRKDFRLPAAWNLAEHRAARGDLARALIANTPCSSWTMALLEGCLLPKQRESFIWPLFYIFRYGQDDTTEDPPEFTNLSEFIAGIEKSQGVLRKHQLSVRDHKPRQMVPVCLAQLTRRAWNKKSTIMSSRKAIDFLNVGLIQTTTDSSSAWEVGPPMHPLEQLLAWEEIQGTLRDFRSSEPTPHLILAPELSVPRGRILQLKRAASALGAVIVAGVDYRLDYAARTARNEALVLVPARWRVRKRSGAATEMFVGKTYPAQREAEKLKAANWTYIHEPSFWIFEGGEAGRFGLSICYDFIDLERALMYKGRLQHLVVISYNRDGDSFRYMAESLARTIYCNVILCNTGYHGGSVAITPYYTAWERTVYRHHGNEMLASQVIRVPVQQMMEAQAGTCRPFQFKSPPPGWAYMNSGYPRLKKREQTI